MKTKLCRNKRAIELSVNFIVVLILAIVTFSLAIGLTYNMFSKAYKLKADIDSDTKSQILSLLDSGEKVAIPANRASIQSGKNEVFGLGILNIEKTSSDFFIEVLEYDKTAGKTRTTGPNMVGIYDKEGRKITDTNIIKGAENIKFNYIETVQDLGSNKQHVALLSVATTKDVLSGNTYVYTIKVHKGSSASDPLYGFPQKLYIEVR
ncbi:MAG: hypothetical protein Q8O89_06860 [Nanoarchaeota archaeon]|nr:hypothetical protein [Nanoarchaeota archaeon]